MENASKALIIAGAILLAIIIISLGLMVVNNARSQIGGANLNKQEIEAFNASWDSQIKTNMTASEVRALYSSVIANNASESSTGSARYVSIICKANVGSNTADVTTSETAYNNVPTFSSNKKYKATVTNYSNGFVSQITIEAN